MASQKWVASSLESCFVLDASHQGDVIATHEFNDQNLSNTAWSLAVRVVADCPLLQSIASESMALISDFHIQGLTNSAWAMATMPFRHEPLLQALS